MATLTEDQVEDLATCILEDDTVRNEVIDYNHAVRDIVEAFEEEFYAEGDMQGIDSEDRKAVFAKCMETFNNPDYNAVYHLGFIRGLKDALEITDPVTITL